MKVEKINYGNYYHLYNHAVGGRDLFYEKDNYEYFLILYDKYIFPIADTYAWVLMPNHFHFLVRIKDEEEILNFNSDRVLNFGRVSKIGTPSHQFSKLFNAYAQAINKRFNKRGSLFEQQFKRKLISDEKYLKNLILYIHKNPVHHRFCGHPIEYPWSSYLTCISLEPTKLQRDKVLDWFDDEANFKCLHNDKYDFKKIDSWLKL